MSGYMCASTFEAAGLIQALEGFTVAFELTRKGEICDNALVFDSDRPGWVGMLPVLNLPQITHLFNKELVGHVDRMVAQYKAEKAGLGGRS